MPVDTNSAPTSNLVDTVLSFSILLVTWVVMSQIFGFFFASWHQNLLQDAVTGAIWAIIMILISPPSANLWTRLRRRFDSK
jgi:hypothetical protein